ncbi:MAG: hypothetical protein KatS3mg131_1874 [Candidatus Tectimicrobiota bacterium]|nr:MAG: hypothetical protein KatS3mg131_1874 [Candidatus Tectomicrobia bacterium]
MRRYVVYGGSFDPIHVGHLSMLERAVAMGYTVLAVPAYRHAFGKRLSPFCHRLRMCELALTATGLPPRARVCGVERQLGEGNTAPVYTYNVLCCLRDKLGEAPYLLVGPDIAKEWERWYQHRRIDQEFGRLCLPVVHPIHSSELRRRIRAGACRESLRPFLPEAVIDYIFTHRLYRDAEPD